MKKYLTFLGLLTFLAAFTALQSDVTRSYAANSRKVAAVTPYDNQDTIPGGDTSRKHKKWKKERKDTSGWPKKDTMPR